MSSALDLVILNGPREGEAVPLSPGEPTRVGRGIRGLQLTDPLVSLQHAQIAWEGDCYWIEDKGSATGTFVNDVRLTDKPVMLVPGMRLRFGETEVEVRPRPRSTLLRGVGLVALVIIVVAALQWRRNSIVVAYDPTVLWAEPVAQGPSGNSPRIRIPDAFVRETGVDHRRLKIERVKDYDRDGVSELWLRWDATKDGTGAAGRRVVTFDADGGWRTLGIFPLECRDRPRPVLDGLPAECLQDPSTLKGGVPDICAQYGTDVGFPDQDCMGVVYRYVDGGYRIVGLDGAVTWMQPTEKVKDEAASKAAKKDVMVAKPLTGPIQPYLFTISKPGQLKQFLAERGVFEPVHYLVCEEAVKGIRPQVLTESGRVVVLPVGCLTNLDLVGPTRVSDFADLRPRMMAFTGHGYFALLNDITVYLGGSDDPSTLPDSKKDPRGRTFKKIAGVPERRQGGIRVLFAAEEVEGTGVAREAPVPHEERLLSSEYADPTPRRVWTTTITEAGTYDLQGCAELKVKVNTWHCNSAKGCDESDPFLEAQNVGCGRSNPKRIPFTNGKHEYKDSAIEGYFVVENYEAEGQIDVLRARFVYGLVEQKAEATPDTPPPAPAP